MKHPAQIICYACSLFCRGAASGRELGCCYSVAGHHQLVAKRQERVAKTSADYTDEGKPEEEGAERA
jgi:hypothetical protein